MKLEIFVDSPEYQAVTSEVPNFSSEYAELQNTSQQEIPPYSIEILVSPPLFDEVNDTILQSLFKKEWKITLLGLWQEVSRIKRSE